MSGSPMRLRNRQTPNKPSISSLSSYDKLISTPISGRFTGDRSDGDGSPDMFDSVQRRKSSRQLNLKDETVTTGEVEGSDSILSNATSNSSVKENNENTPRIRNKLSRNRSIRTQSFVVESSINDADKSIKCTIRRQSVCSTPKTRKLPLRRSSRHLIVSDIVDNSTDDDDEGDERPRRRNASYFTKQDFEDYQPEVDLEELQTSSEDEDLAEDNTSEDDSDTEQVTEIPKMKSLMSQDLSKLAMTPELLNKLEGRSVRSLAVNSPVATGSHTMSPNPETYFLAENRVKYKSNKNESEVMNDAMKGKRRKRRKLAMDGESRLPEKIPTDFSVSVEAMKATVSAEDFLSGNIHEEEVETLHRNVIEHEFPHWLGLFRDGFNVMLYGYGSKLSLFKEFDDFVNNHYLTISINGLFPKLVPRKLLYGICEYVNPNDQIPHGANLEAVAKDAVNILKTVRHSDIFVLVNNFDNMALRFPQMLSVLCWLSQVPYIHILASCDTVNAFLGVTQSQSLQLNFRWMHCPTYKSYREELKWIPGIYGNETKVVTQKSSLKYVLQSLTGNARKAFSLLAQMQLRQMKSRTVQKAKEAYTGVRFQELAKECREKFIAHSDENLRTLLVEFFDHKLIRQSGKGKHLENSLLIELDLETLEEIISELA